MDVGSPKDGYDEINDFFKNDDSTFPDDLDLNFIVNKDISRDYDFSDLTIDDKFDLDITKPEKQEIPSSSSNFRYYDNPGCPSENLFSSLEDAFLHGNLGERDVDNPKILRNHSNDNLHHEKTEDSSSSYFHDSIFEMESKSVLCQVQNNAFSQTEELISMQQANLREISDRPTSPADNGIGVYPCVEGLRSRLGNSECISRDADEAVQVDKKKDSFADSLSGLRDPQMKCAEKNESRSSPSGYGEAEPLDGGPKKHVRSPELCISLNKNSERLGSPNISGSSQLSPCIHEAPALQPKDEITSNSPLSRKQAHSPTRCEIVPSSEHTPHAGDLISRSHYGLMPVESDVPAVRTEAKERIVHPKESQIKGICNKLCSSSEHIHDQSDEHEIISNENNGVITTMPQSYATEEKFSSANNRDCQNRSPTHKKESEPSANQSPPRVENVFPSKKVPEQWSSRSSQQKHISSYRSNSRCQSKSPCSRDDIVELSSEVYTECQNFKTRHSEEVMGQGSSSARLSEQKDEPAERSNHRRYRSRSSSRKGRCCKKSPEAAGSHKSPRNPLVSPSEGVSQLPPSSRLSNQKPESSETTKHNSSQSKSSSTRDCHKRSPELSHGKGAGSEGFPSSLISDKHKYKLDDKSKYKRPRSRSPIKGETDVKLLLLDSSLGQKTSGLQDDSMPASSPRSGEKRSVSNETSKRKRSFSRSPCIGDRKKKPMGKTPSSSPSSNRHILSVSRERLSQLSSSRQCDQIDTVEKSDLVRESPSSDAVGCTHSTSPKKPGEKSIDGSSAKYAPGPPKNNSKQENISHQSSYREHKWKDEPGERSNWIKELGSSNYVRHGLSVHLHSSRPGPAKNSSMKYGLASSEPPIKRESPLRPSSSTFKPKHESAERSNLGTEFGSRKRRLSVSPQSSSQRPIDSSGKSPASLKINPTQENIFKASSSSKERKQKDESANRPNLDKEYVPSSYFEGKHSASPRGSRQRIANDSSEKRTPSSPKRQSTHQVRQHRGRSISPPKVRRKEMSSGEIHTRSRSRSRGERENAVRSPRRRRSSRHRTPPRKPKWIQWSPPPDRNTGLGKPGKNLFIAGFSFITTERDLEKKFSRFGRVRDVRIVRDRCGESRGFGFLTLDRDEQADAAIRALDKTEWGGRIVLVEKSKSHFRSMR